jgi:hypothetical protein
MSDKSRVKATEEMTPSRHVRGHCPMGCGETLFLALAGYVICSCTTCHNPSAVSLILHESEIFHIVKIEESGFSIKHPIRERIGEDLFKCQLHEYLSGLDELPVVPGRYQVHGSGWEKWTPLLDLSSVEIWFSKWEP